MTDTPRLIILTGLPGSGKTTLAHELSDRHGFVVASRDTIRAAMFPQCRYTLDEKGAAFGALKQAIAIMLRLGISVVTDGICFSSQRERQEVEHIAVSAGVPSVMVDCQCPIDVAQARVEYDRRTDPTAFADRDAALVTETSERFDPLPSTAIPLDMTAPPEAVVEEAANKLGLT